MAEVIAFAALCGWTLAFVFAREIQRLRRAASEHGGHGRD